MAPSLFLEINATCILLLILIQWYLLLRLFPLSTVLDIAGATVWTPANAATLRL